MEPRNGSSHGSLFCFANWGEFAVSAAKTFSIFILYSIALPDTILYNIYKCMK